MVKTMARTDDMERGCRHREDRMDTKQRRGLIHSIPDFLGLELDASGVIPLEDLIELPPCQSIEPDHTKGLVIQLFLPSLGELVEALIGNFAQLASRSEQRLFRRKRLEWLFADLKLFQLLPSTAEPD